MARRENKKKKRVLHLAVIFTFTAIVFGTATYAWFIGMRTVNVNPFEVQIAATESLQLSLDGTHWADTVSINSSNYKNPAAANASENTLEAEGNPYSTNTNTWGGRGLIPMSSIGVIDTSASRLTLFEKGSLTATAGGYRLMASRVDNYSSSKTPDGYVAFDLFIKNLSGEEYYTDLSRDNEEAIYLTNNSKVTVGSSGVANTGIENSVRVAFAEIGRVIATTTDASKIQGINCTGGNGVTGICRTAQIWEPNDTKHVGDALNWYDTTCLARAAGETNDSSKYSGSCGTVVNGQAYPTYAIGKEITAMTAVDVYDGAAFNGYEGSIATTEAMAISTASTGENAGAGKYLYAYPTFTDTMKLKTGVERPTFITLAPNSITKVRVYIYIEGQDIDNYDFASIGKQISVNFGFTKERFTEDDINYAGPVLNQGTGPNSATDYTAPVIKLTKDGTTALTAAQQTMTIDKGDTWTDPTVLSVTDNVSTIATSAVTKDGVVNTAVPGTYRILYEVADDAGNVATEVVTVIVRDTAATSPVQP